MDEQLVTKPTFEPPQAVFQTSIPNKSLRVRFSEKERARITEALDLLHGHKCASCGTSQALEIHHRNGTQDNRLESLAWLCKSCNLSARVLIPSVGLDSVSVPSGADDQDALEINRIKEPAWLDWVSRQLSFGPVYKDILTGNSAHEIGLSVATVARYWKKHACPLGPFRIFRPKEKAVWLVDLRRGPSQ